MADAKVHFVEREIGGRTLRMETGRIAKLAVRRRRKNWLKPFFGEIDRPDLCPGIQDSLRPDLFDFHFMPFSRRSFFFVRVAT